jgi:hypothetical protein
MEKLNAPLADITDPWAVHSFRRNIMKAMSEGDKLKND